MKNGKEVGKIGKGEIENVITSRLVTEIPILDGYLVNYFFYEYW